MTEKQAQAARRNLKKAQQAARAKKTIAHLPEETRRDLGRQAAKSRQRGVARSQPEDRPRQDLYDVAKARGMRGRSNGQVGPDRGDPPRELNPQGRADLP